MNGFLSAFKLLLIFKFVTGSPIPTDGEVCSGALCQGRPCGSQIKCCSSELAKNVIINTGRDLECCTGSKQPVYNKTSHFCYGREVVLKEMLPDYVEQCGSNRVYDPRNENCHRVGYDQYQVVPKRNFVTTTTTRRVRRLSKANLEFYYMKTNTEKIRCNKRRCTTTMTGVLLQPQTISASEIDDGSPFSPTLVSLDFQLVLRHQRAYKRPKQGAWILIVTSSRRSGDRLKIVTKGRTRDWFLWKPLSFQLGHENDNIVATVGHRN